jgi:hypothetical protein
MGVLTLAKTAEIYRKTGLGLARRGSEATTLTVSSAGGLL